ncbi:hypothetical protein GGX14DRAFT_480004 [Mycena pura]|uniref:Major facilitator superfamily transporter n=1 Tax=Mycena pura TaxID=153505 RepID=A0AAD6Y5L9_9AGAR|nr:hypothetical protein GGX14DRAFT_480004 [Mycena pura]
MSSPSEDTPLLARRATDLSRPDLFGPYRRVLLATFLLSTTFWFTSTPLIYACRVFNCEEYYADPAHPPYTGTGDACAITAVETSTARDISVMVTLTTLSGTANLLLTTWQIRHWGMRTAMVQQTFWPALRNLTQIYATFVGGRLGMTIVQTTQLITILGGGAGYMLSANSYINELVEPAERTAAFGVLAGMNMLGTALGYIAGGLAGDLISISAPFEITFCLLVLSTAYTRLLLPYIPPAATTDAAPDGTASKQGESFFSFLACLRVFLPVKYELHSGTFWGLTLLGLGTFGGTLATGYVPMMLQLTATNSYGYKPSDNGYLMSTLSMSRALFLTFAFPRIIDAGRRWFAMTSVTAVPASADAAAAATSVSGRSRALPACAHDGAKSALPTDAPAVDAPQDPCAIAIAAVADKAPGSRFDLAFVQWSMVVDAVLTALVAFNSRAWHMNAAAAVLPLASGTAPACKGVLMDIVPDTRRTDALAGIALIEILASISTVSLFGMLFVFLSAIGHPNLVFVCNAALALVAASVLFAVRFPKGKLRAM